MQGVTALTDMVLFLGHGQGELKMQTKPYLEIRVALNQLKVTPRNIYLYKVLVLVGFKLLALQINRAYWLEGHG
jgi:hypothetical protein